MDEQRETTRKNNRKDFQSEACETIGKEIIMEMDFDIKRYQ